MEYVIAVTFFAFFFLGYLVGQHRERVAWNDLIERGILPRPKGK